MGQSNSSPDEQYADSMPSGPNGTKSAAPSVNNRPAVVASQLATGSAVYPPNPTAPQYSSDPNAAYNAQFGTPYGPDTSSHPMNSLSPDGSGAVSPGPDGYYDSAGGDYASQQGPQSLSGLVRGLVDQEPSVNDSADASSSPQFQQFGVPPLYFPPQKIETVPTAFKWVHGGNEVFVTGSFNNWQGKILMYKNEDGEFSLIIDIPPGTHHYKYIVDQEWMLDEDANTIEVNGVVNNVVEVKRPVFEYVSGYADSDDEGDPDDRKQRTDYGQRAPLSSDYVNEPPKLPPHLSEILLNQTQPTDPQMLPVPQHVVLNHLYILSSADPSLFITGITQRFKPNSHTSKITHKFVTTVFYSPKPKTSSQMPIGPSGNTQYPLPGFGAPAFNPTDSHSQAYFQSPTFPPKY